MHKIIASTVIHQPVERVFAFSMDPGKQPLWQPETVVNQPVDPIPGQTAGGWRVKARGWAGLTLDVINETQEIVPNERYSATTREVHGWITSRSQWQFAPVAGETQVSIQHDFELHGPLRLFGPIFIPLARRKVEADLVRLKGLLERE